MSRLQIRPFLPICLERAAHGPGLEKSCCSAAVGPPLSRRSRCQAPWHCEVLAALRVPASDLRAVIVYSGKVDSTGYLTPGRSTAVRRPIVNVPVPYPPPSGKLRHRLWKRVHLTQFAASRVNGH